MPLPDFETSVGEPRAEVITLVTETDPVGIVRVLPTVVPVGQRPGRNPLPAIDVPVPETILEVPNVPFGIYPSGGVVKRLFGTPARVGSRRRG